MSGDGRVARAFHDRTAHSPASVRAGAHGLDWDIKPFPFKVYVDLPARPLPRDFDPVAADALAALAADAAPAAAPLTLDRLAALLYFSAGVTRKKTYPGGGEVLFRAAASTGALFQTEVYVAAGDVDGLAPGLYHFCPGDFALRLLRDGDVRGVLAAAAADEAVAGRAATIVLSAIYWRNTWKYQARGYRHLFWDSGTMLANLLAVGTALGAGPRLLTGFVDAGVNRLLGLDPDREAALELVVVGPAAGPGVGRGGPVRAGGVAAAALAPLDHRVMPLSSREVDYPLLREIHRASELDTAAAVEAWRAAAPPPARAPRGPLEALPEPARRGGRGLGETIQHRGSTREFSHEPIGARELATALASATRPIPADVPSGLVDLYLVVNAVEGIAPGAYRYGPEGHGLERLSGGTYRRQSAHLTLEQSLGGDAAAVIYFLAPLDALLDAYGNRGYRLANLEAGIAGGRAYLAAYAQRFGATGLTFYDGDVVRFFSPAAAGLDAIFVTALGRAARGVRAGATPLLHAR
jgi:SagB-type dehydrogenase family enzyme